MRERRSTERPPSFFSHEQEGSAGGFERAEAEIVSCSVLRLCARGNAYIRPSERVVRVNLRRALLAAVASLFVVGAVTLTPPKPADAILICQAESNSDGSWLSFLLWMDPVTGEIDQLDASSSVSFDTGICGGQGE